MRRASAIVLLAGLACACGGPAPTVRLLEAGTTAEAEGPAPTVPPIGESPVSIGDLPWRERIGQVAMTGELGWDARVALLGGDRTIYRFQVAVPRDAVLRVGLGFQRKETRKGAPVRVAAGVRVRHRVRVLPAGYASGDDEDAVTILDDPHTLRARTAWRDRELDLEPWGGKTVELELATFFEAPEGVALPPGLVAAWSAPEVVALGDREPVTGDGWNLLLVSLDTLRADHLGAYGHERPTSPALDALAARGVRFATAVSQAPWTRPSHRSMLTGLYPVSNHGLQSPLLAEVLWRAGYRTTAITGGGQVAPRFGFDAGFERYRIDRWDEKPARVVRAFEANRGRRQLVFLHTYRVHDPYRGDAFTKGLPRDRIGETFGEADWRRFDKSLSRREQRYVEALYDSGVRAVDEAMGELLGELDRRGFLERTIVVVTSDHGEQLWEHGGWRHGQNLYDEQLLVPLLLYLPPALAEELGVAPGTVIDRQVELVDLYPTLLDLLGIERDHPVQGRSLLPLLTGGDLEPRDAFAENTNIQAWERKMFRSERFKFIKSIPRAAAKSNPRGAGAEIGFELYDLRRDPGELHDVSTEHADVLRQLDARLRALGASLEGLDEELPADLDPELRKQLEALGYLGD